MPVEFIGFIGTNSGSETHPNAGPVLDRDYIETIAKAHDAGGFDRALIAFGSTSPESILVAAHAASVTDRLSFMIAHRPGFTAPTVAARQLATLDQLTGGRVAVHIITGGSDDEMKRDGDHLNKDERYERTSEYLDIFRLEWTSPKPFDYEGKYYNVKNGFGAVKPLPEASSSGLFRRLVRGRHSGGRQTRRHLRPVGRDPGSSERDGVAGTGSGGQVGTQPPLQPLAAARPGGYRGGRLEAGAGNRGPDPRAEGRGWSEDLRPRAAQRRRAAPLDAAALGNRLDKRLWTGVAALTGASGNSTGLVGTPEQVADALLDYHDLGVSTFLIRGFDPLEDAVAYGRDLIPLVREQVALRDANPARVAV